jgi:hypothetical protein
VEDCPQLGSGAAWDRMRLGGRREEERGRGGGGEREREKERERETIHRIWAQAGQGCELRNYAPFVVAWNGGGGEGGGGGTPVVPGRLLGTRHDQEDEQEQE